MHAGKIMELARRMLHHANRGNSRYSFLREVSGMLFDFTMCDALEILHRDGDLTYKWEADRVHQPASKLEVLHHSPSRSLTNWLSSGTTRERLYGFVLKGEYDGDLQCFTKRGGFFTGNLNQLPGQIVDAIQAPSDEEDWSGYFSVAVLPFTIDDDNTGVLVLKSRTSGFFTRYEVEFYEGIAQTFGLAAADRRAQAALRERVKELTCLYGIARIAEDEETSLDEKLQRIVELLPPSWQHPDIAVARIVLDGVAHTTPDFRDGRYKQTATIEVNEKQRGFVEVVYTDDKPELKAIPFLKEEASLIDEVARQIGVIIENDEAVRERIRLQEQLRHADRLATIGQLTAGVAHELNEPLGSVLGFAQLAKKSLPDPERCESAARLSQDLEKIEKAALHARGIIREMLIFARQMPTKKTVVDLNKVVVEAVSFFKSRCMSEGIELICELSDDLPEIEADPAQMNQLLVNLIVNAIQAMPEGGCLTVRTAGDDLGVSLEVEDTGIGMNGEIKSKIFDPFLTTKDVSKGTGLGLSVAHGIVSSHRGTIDVESRVGLGSRFTVRLPPASRSVVKHKRRDRK